MNILLFIWQILQNICGCFVWLFVTDHKKYYHITKDGNKVFFHWEFGSGLSLGNFRFVNEKCSELTSKHEYGHSIQSKYLGPLYLIIIGLPSLIWCSIYTLRRKGNYYSFYTEKWADKLGKVERV